MNCPSCGLAVAFHGGFRVWFHYPNTNPRCWGPSDLPIPQTTETTETTERSAV